MCFISKDEVAEVRSNLKKEFGNGFKFSVVRVDYSRVCVSILSGDILDWSEYYICENEDFLDPYQVENQNARVLEIKEGYYSINHYNIARSWDGEGRDILSKILQCCQNGGGSFNQNAGDLGADYPDMTYFIDIKIGKYNKPYTQKKLAWSLR